MVSSHAFSLSECDSVAALNIMRVHRVEKSIIDLL